jgi:hypothetical protein
MKTEYSLHIEGFNDILVQIAIHYCDSNKLYSFFNKYEVKSIPYKSNIDYLEKAINNFFSKENIVFIRNEIVGKDNVTENIFFRKKIRQIFNNICILLGRLEFNFDSNNFRNNILYFIEQVDFNSHDLSLLALPLLNKPKFFNQTIVLKLIRKLLSRDSLSEGYLLTNCVVYLEKSGFNFNEKHTTITNLLIKNAIKHPQFNLLEDLPSLLNEEYLKQLKNEINKSLNLKFNINLFYYSLIANVNDEPYSHINDYLDQFKGFKDVRGFFYQSPYTGLYDPLRKNLNQLVVVLYKLNDEKLFKKPIIKEITETYLYYNFILNPASFDYKKIDVMWLLENQSDFVLKKISKHSQIKQVLEEHLKQKNDEKLSKLYFKYFLND